MADEKAVGKAVEKKLTPREVKFFLAYIDGATYQDAYLSIRPGLSAESARKMGSRMAKTIKTKINWQGTLELAGLGEMRLAQEINLRLKAMSTEFYEGKAITDVQDNGTRMRATALLADLHGKKKAELDVNLKSDNELTVFVNKAPEKPSGA